MRRRFERFALGTLGSLMLAGGVVEAGWPEVEEVLATRCVECHHAGEAKGDLRLDRFDALREEETRFWIRERIGLPEEDAERMPPPDAGAPLSAEERALLESWLGAGAPWPAGRVLASREPGEREALLAESLSGLTIYPEAFRLDRTEDVEGLSVVLTLADGTQRDVTHLVDLRVEDPGVAELEGPRLHPAGTGRSRLRATFGGLEAVAPVEVAELTAPAPREFTADVLPVMTRFGCNTGACHGSASGQDGFHLSLFGYDPDGDYHAVTREQPGRRINLAVPEASLLVTKATGAAPHAGGKRFDRSSEAADVLIDWIAEGARPDPDDALRPERIEIFPRALLVETGGRQVPLQVRAFYPDGTDRDVTHLAAFTTSRAESVEVDENGKLRSGDRGEAFIMARFHTFTEGAEVIVIPREGDYVRKEEPLDHPIDRAISEKLHRLRIQPSDLCDDPTFLRRAYLDLVGRLPTLEEQEGFLTDDSPGKREALVTRLVLDPAFTDLWVMKFAEMLQIRSDRETKVSYKGSTRYFEWLQERLGAGVALDQLVRELMTASGSGFRNPPAHFYQTEQDPLLMAETVAQSFLGIRLQCAQCHNHPFDRWTMDDYYGWASFFSQVGRKNGIDPREVIIYDRGSGKVKHPVTNGDVPPKVLGGPAVGKEDERDRREIAAEWVASAENPWFARHLANVIWAHFFGRGIVEPVDDVRLSNPPSNAALLDLLAERLVASDFDLVDLAEWIAQSRAYQRSTSPNATNAGDLTQFSRAQIRRIRAEVLLDSVGDLTGTPTKFKGLPLGARAVEIPDGSVSNYFLTTFGRAERATACSCEVSTEPNLSQALHLMNGPTVHNAIRKGGRIREWLEQGEEPGQIITRLYREAFCREPTASELAHLLQEMPAGDEAEEAYLEDLFWAILNAKEFVFNH